MESMRLIVVAVAVAAVFVTSARADVISDQLLIEKHDGTIVDDSLKLIEESADGSLIEGAAGVTIKTLAENLNVVFNSPTTAYLLEQNMSSLLVVSDKITLNIHQDADQKLMVDFDFEFTSDPHSGLTVPDGTPESQLFTENDGTTFDITSALFPLHNDGQGTQQPFVVIAISDLDTPEPSSGFLVCCGFLLLAIWYRVRRTNPAGEPTTATKYSRL